MVSYKEVKEKITIEQVLKKYGVQYSKKGKRLAATCPFCAGGGFKASPKKTALSVSPKDVTQKGIFLILSLFPKMFPSKKRRRYFTISL
jgi:hypothetical protein